MGGLASVEGGQFPLESSENLGCLNAFGPIT